MLPHLKDVAAINRHFMLNTTEGVNTVATEQFLLENSYPRLMTAFERLDAVNVTDVGKVLRSLKSSAIGVNGINLNMIKLVSRLLHIL